ncbi:SDR family NAD(P)-dependent oxidoreductase [Streptomyces mirabilis]
MELENRTALITGAGATGGIGAEIARTFAREGASVIITGRNAERGEEVVKEIRDAGGTVRFVLADLGNIEDVQRLVKEAGPVDILVNNAASYLNSFGPTVEQDPKAFSEALDTNIRAPFFLVAGLAPAMVEKGWGSIINIGSIAANITFEGMPVYGAAKAAAESLTRSWASEFGASNVRVNTVSPGTVKSDAVYGIMGDETFDLWASRSPLKRNAAPSEIAEVVLFLASDRASFITGQTIVADGGRVTV